MLLVILSPAGIDSDNFSNTALKFLELLRIEIFDEFPECSTIDSVLESSSKFQFTNDWLAIRHHAVRKQGASTLLDLNVPNTTISVVPHLRYIIKYNFVCSIVVYITDDFLRHNSDLSNLGRFTSWQNNFVQSVPDPSHTFVIYFVMDDAEISSKIKPFSKLAAVLHRYVFAIRDSTDGFTLCKSYTSDFEIIKVGAFSHNHSDTIKMVFSQRPENMQGHVYSFLSCPMCGEALEYFKKERVWDNFVVAPVYELADVFNMTLEMQPIFGLPLSGLNDDGELDEFTQPLLDGSFAVSTMIKPSPIKFEVILLSMPAIYDSVVFITGPPRKVTSGSVAVLHEPLESEVWLVFVVTLSLIFCTLKMVIYFRKASASTASIIRALLYPVLEQVVEDMQKLQTDSLIANLSIVWLLSLIVLGCCYKSKLISAMVIPNVIRPPGTFDELIKSNYTMNAIFYVGNVESDLIATNSSISRGLLGRVTEYDYLDAECYTLIFEGDNVCLGYNMIFDGIGVEKMVDIHRRKMWTVSKDSHFLSSMQYGISKLYPWLLNPLNTILHIHSDLGFKHLYQSKSQMKALKKGQAYALRNVAAKPYYQGFQNSDTNALKFLELLRIEIFDEFPECSTIDSVLESSSKFQFTNDWLAIRHHAVRKQGASTLLDLTVPNITISVVPHLRYIIKYNFICSIVVYITDDFLRQNSDLSNLGRFTSWQNNFVQSVPDPSHTFVIYFVMDDAEISSKVKPFSKLAAVLHHYVFAIRDSTDGFALFKCYTSDFELSKVGTLSYDNSDTIKMIFSQRPENMQGHVYSVLSCPMCGDALEYFEKERVWDNFVMAPVHELADVFNMTLEMQPIFGLPLSGVNDAGEFDEFTQPLLDGSFAISIMVEPSPIKFEVILLSTPAIYDSVVFITGPPRKVTSGSVAVLHQPLEPEAWLGFAVTLSVIFCTLKMVIYFRKASASTASIIRALLYPVLEQVVEDMQKLQKDSLIAKLSIMWLLSLIVLGCCYKSNLISVMVIPNVIKPPGTFDELIKSNYTINAIFYVGNIESDLTATNSSISRGLLGRVTEYDYLDAECYILIFEGNNVCLGYNMIFDGIGIEKMVDIHRRKMWTVSKDSHFLSSMQYGISKFYPWLLKPLNTILHIHCALGFKLLYWNKGHMKSLKKGQAYALRNVAAKPYYQGFQNSDTHGENKQFLEIMIKLFVAGITISVVVFIFEFLKYNCERTEVEVISVLQITMQM
ncbi:unnamed protein product [Allacma fusca]|uniref:Uncharacterized protein n=1 Tax=Allacma fusca TaxID=39272 RepID=A0A8J2JNL4_9HEXA|nr:unnamed protein product [Allacma fusca]